MVQGFWPGKSHRTSVRVDTNAVEVAEAAGDFWKTVEKGATDIYFKQEEDKFSTFKIEVKKLETEYAVKLGQEQDESKYDKMLDEYKSQVNAAMPSGGPSGKLAGFYAENNFIDNTERTRLAQHDRLENKWEVSTDILRKDAIKTGILTEYFAKEDAGVLLYNHDLSEAEARKMEAAKDAEKTAAENIVLGPNPELFLDNYKTTQDLKKDYPLLTPGDFQDLRSNAISQQRYIEGKKVDVGEKAEAGITNDIIKGKKTPQEIQIDITNKIDAGILDGTQGRVLMNFQKSQMSNTGKTATQIEMGDATNKIYDAIESGKRDEAKNLWRENAWMFTTSKNDEINDDIREIGTKSTDVLLTDGLAAEGRFTTDYKRSLEISGASKEELANLETNSMRRREQIRQYFKKKPDDTPDQKTNAVEAILAPPKDDMAKDIVTRKWWKGLGSGAAPLFGGPGRGRLDPKKENPYKDDYPDAFQVGKDWYVTKDGKRYRIKD